MEGLKKRAFIIGGLFVLTGAVVWATPKASFANPKSEATLEQLAPMGVKDYKMLPSDRVHEDPKLQNVSYRMDESTYAELKPYGIVARIMEKGDKRFDVVLISSNKKSSFHDPRVCFRAQGWTFKEEEQAEIETSRGKIPVTMVRMVDKNQQPYIAAFTYKGPQGFRSTPQSLAFSMLIEQIKGRTDIEGAFYRFIPLYENATEAELKDFIRMYLEEAEKTSKGFF